MLKTLNDNLASIEGEVVKMKSAVEHIQKSKEAAATAIQTFEISSKAYKEHITNITSAIDSILKPHVDLIAATENTIATIKAVDFPERLARHDKELNTIKFTLWGIAAVNLIILVLMLVRS